jgi:hypothetical protein
MALERKPVKQGHNRFSERCSRRLYLSFIGRPFVFPDNPCHLTRSTKKLDLLALDE